MLAITTVSMSRWMAFSLQQGPEKGTLFPEQRFRLAVGKSFLGDFWKRCLPRWGAMFLGQTEAQGTLLDASWILPLAFIPTAVALMISYLDNISHLPVLRSTSLSVPSALRPKGSFKTLLSYSQSFHGSPLPLG